MNHMILNFHLDILTGFGDTDLESRKEAKSVDLRNYICTLLQIKWVTEEIPFLGKELLLSQILDRQILDMINPRQTNTRH